jgi:arylsulfatase A-like enzyme
MCFAAICTDFFLFMLCFLVSRYLPHERGFEKFLGYMGPGHGYYDFSAGSDQEKRDMLEGQNHYDESTGDWTDPTWTEGIDYLGTYDTQLYLDRSATYIREHAKKYLGGDDSDYRPFFLWSAQHGIHSEMDSEPEPPVHMLTAEDKKFLEYLDTTNVDDNDEDHKVFLRMRKLTASVLMSIDYSLRNLVQELEKADMLRNSVILVNSDNGGDTVYTKGHPGNNFPLRSEKFSHFEGGIRVPAFVYAPWVRDFETKHGGTEFHGLMHHVDLLTTFVALGGGKLSHEENGLDGYNMWPAILGSADAPRDELVLNMPRNRAWTPGERITDEGVALRMGHYKLLLNHVTDGWFSPAVNSEFWTLAADMQALPCMYNFYKSGSYDNGCNYAGFLFNVVDDPTEKHNLIGREDQKERVASMITRAKEIIGADLPNYGKIVYEFYKDPADSETIQAAFNAHNDFAVPWACDVIP